MIAGLLSDGHGTSRLDETNLRRERQLASHAIPVAHWVREPQACGRHLKGSAPNETMQGRL
jgi:hypothetical protein